VLSKILLRGVYEKVSAEAKSRPLYPPIGGSPFTLINVNVFEEKIKSLFLFQLIQPLDLIRQLIIRQSLMTFKTLSVTREGADIKQRYKYNFSIL